MKIIKPVFGGYGLGFENSRTFFIEKAVAGDEINPFIYKKRKRVLFGRIDSIISPSPERIEPLCPHFENCAGCSYQIVPYSHELDIKREVFEETMERLSGIKCSVSDFIPSDDRYHYRNKIEASIKKDKEGSLNIGFHRRDDWRRVIDIEKCLLANQSIQEFYSRIRMFLNKNSSMVPDELTHFTMRSNREGDILLVLWFENLKEPCSFLDALKGFSCKGLKGIKAYNSIISEKKNTVTDLIFSSGSLIIEDHYGKCRFAMSPESFFQVNPYITEKIIERLINVSRDERPRLMFDLFSGSGFWGIILSDYAEHVTGVEISELSEREFNYNCRINGIRNYDYYRADVRHFLRESDEMPDIILIDPPRAGISPRVIRRISRRSAKKIIYISCNPSTLARDLQELSSAYEIDSMVLYDMFPCTFHVECMAILKRKS